MSASHGFEEAFDLEAPCRQPPLPLDRHSAHHRVEDEEPRRAAGIHFSLKRKPVDILTLQGFQVDGGLSIRDRPAIKAIPDSPGQVQHRFPVGLHEARKTSRLDHAVDHINGSAYILPHMASRALAPLSSTV